MGDRVPFADLKTCDLVPGTIYEAGAGGTLAVEPLGPLLGVGNQGGFRQKGPADRCFVALTSNDNDHWVDTFDERSGLLRYHGDNRTPGLLFEPKGNALLRSIFARGFDDTKARSATPPFFAFIEAGAAYPSRSVRFLGLAVPGTPLLAEEDWLVVKWFKSGDVRFENYVMSLTVLDTPCINRSWIEALKTGEESSHAPEAYERWISTGQRRSIGLVG